MQSGLVVFAKRGIFWFGEVPSIRDSATAGGGECCTLGAKLRGPGRRSVIGKRMRSLARNSLFIC